MSKLSRRSLVASAAALPALTMPAVALQSDDAALRELWSEYLVRAAASDAVDERYFEARCDFHTELPPCPDDVARRDHLDAHQWLKDKHGLGLAYDAAVAANERLKDVINRILQIEATSLFGIGIKLAAVHPSIQLGEPRGWGSSDPEDYLEENVASVLRDINRLLGTDFVGMSKEDEDDDQQQDEEA
jgi:hypothetical protein